MIGVFNQEGELLCYSDGEVDEEKFLVKDFGADVKPEMYAWLGSYEDGELLKILSDEYFLKYAELSVDEPVNMYEENLNEQTTKRIVEKHGYDLFKQISIIADALVGANVSGLSDEFNKMHKVITAERKQLKKRKVEMAKDTKSFTYVEKGKADAAANAHLEKIISKINDQ